MSGFFVDDGQRIINLMCYSCCQTAQRGHFVGIFHLMQGTKTLLVCFVHLIHQAGCHGQRRQQYQKHACHQKPGECIGCLIPWLLWFASVFDNHQDKWCFRNVGIADDVIFIFQFFALEHLGLWKRLRDGQIDLFQHFSIITGRRLQDPFMVDDKRFTLFTNVDLRD